MKIIKLCWLQEKILGGRFMQALEPLKNHTKMFSSSFVTEEMYLIAGKRLLKNKNQKKNPRGK